MGDEEGEWETDSECWRWCREREGEQSDLGEGERPLFMGVDGGLAMLTDMVLGSGKEAEESFRSVWSLRSVSRRRARQRLGELDE
jgi:hypothetical protein